jgi:hypothetical protein
MEKKPRKRKALDIKIDTKHVDVHIKRDENGTTDVVLDTPIVDAHFHKDVDGKKSFEIEIDDDKEYEFVSNGTADHLPKGTIWKVTGEMLKLFLKNKYGKLK